MNKRKISTLTSPFRAAAAGIVAVSLGVWACSDEARVVDRTAPPAPELGRLDLALQVSGLSIDSVDLRIQSEDLDPAVVRNRSFDVRDSGASISASEQGLPAGTYLVALDASVLDDPATGEDESDIECAGSISGVVVAAGQTTAVDDLVLRCAYGGGDLLVAGGIRVEASVEVDPEPACGELVRELSVAPLSASVGGSVSLLALAEPGAVASWSAEAGSISLDGTTYTCPDVPGQYEVQATFRASDACQRSYSEIVSCRSDYAGECGALPRAFAFEGSCGLRSPCHLEQDGCSWEATCRGRTIRGEASGENLFSFIDTATTRLTCTTTLVDGELVGTCQDAAGATCSVATNSSPAPTAACETLAGTIGDLTACGSSPTSCDVIRDGCRFQARCGDGTLRDGQVLGDVLQWNVDERPSGGNYYRCQEPIVGGQVSGTCRRLRGELEPESCSDFSASVPLANFGDCRETLPSGGFKLAGCGLDGACFARQRGCVWELICPSGTYRGIASESNRFEFENAAGDSCSASVVDGEVVGSCTGSGGVCAFSEVQPAVDDGCLSIPPVVVSSGCGGSQTCEVLQDGCSWSALCTAGPLSGTADATGMTWPGLNPDYTCRADLSEDGSQMTGNCTRQNADGSVSQCRDLTAVQDDRLVLTFPETE